MFEYKPRSAGVERALAVNGYTLKNYQLHLTEGAPLTPPLAAGELQQIVASLLPKADAQDHGVGFVIVHYARDGTYLLISRWTGGNNLRHRAYTLTRERSAWKVEDLAPTGIVACVWELEIMKFERDAWVRTVMARCGEQQAFVDYLGAQFSGWV